MKGKSRNWFEELDRRIDDCHYDENALHRISNKIAWCRRFGHLSEPETSELCAKVSEAFEVCTALLRR